MRTGSILLSCYDRYREERVSKGGARYMSSRLTGSDIVRTRLYNQRLAGQQFEKAEEVVQWLGAVQSQEYTNTKWGIAQRTGSLADAAIDQAFADGKILRTHVMRPTWHFVVPEDIRWMLA